MTLTQTHGQYVARAVSAFGWKRVRVGRGFEKLSHIHRVGVLAHEMGHCHYHHTEIRILLLLIPFMWLFLPWVCRRQELQADRYAAKTGFGPELYDFLLQHGGDGGLLHPSGSDRLAALSSPRMVPVTDHPPARRNRTRS